MDYFEVVNWDKYQHYKDRDPPWIKLYHRLLDNYRYSCLQDASKLHLITIYLLASRTKNRMPFDAQWVKRKGMLTSDVELGPLFEHGFIVLCEGASKTLAECLQDARPETETETYKSRREEKSIARSNPKPDSSEQEINPADVFISIPLKGKAGEHHVTKSDIEKLEAEYPSLDVPYQIRKLTRWDIDNPRRRKKRTGIKRHINYWLGEAEKKGNDTRITGHQQALDDVTTKLLEDFNG